MSMSDTPQIEETYEEGEATAVDHPDDVDAAPLDDDATVEEPADSFDSDEVESEPTAAELDEADEDPGDTPILDELKGKG